MIDRLSSNRRMVAVVAIMIVLVVVNIMFFMQWQTAKDERSEVETRKNASELRLKNAVVEYDIYDLESQRDSLASGAKFPTDIPVVGLTLFLAEGAYLTRIDLEIVQPPAKIATEKIGSKNYPVYDTKLKVTGSLSQIVAFLEYIEGGAFSSIRVQDVVCDGTEAGWVAEFTVVLITQS